MSTRSALECRDDRRRQAVRDSELNGIDYIEIVDPRTQTELRVHLFRDAPAHLHRENVRIDGGERIRDIRVNRAVVDHDSPTCIDVRVDRAGDFSTYTLRLVEIDHGHATEVPLRGFDPRHARADFSFKVGCPSPLDCADETPCPPPTRTEPDINYLAKDYATFRQLILDRLALIMPEWRERHVPDVGITLVELLAYVGDHLSYYQDAVATEAYFFTARKRISIRRHAQLIDYHLHEGCNARAWLTIATSQDTEFLARDVYFATGTHEARGEVFEPRVDDPAAPIHLYQAHNEIHFYTWGDQLCCLSKGATRATLRDHWVAAGQKTERTLKNLKAGDFLIFEEVKGPTTGNPADADPTHRHVVRLVDVTFTEDSLFKDSSDAKYERQTTPVVEVSWRREDALPFSLCISSRREATREQPYCDVITDVSVARGNVILVDHGETVADGELGQVEIDTEVGACTCDNRLVDITNLPKRFEPRLTKVPLTFAEPIPKHASAARIIRQDPHKAYPEILSLVSMPGYCRDEEKPSYASSEPKHPGWRWHARQHLVRSSAHDRDFVVEIDDEGVAHLRFGDGELGMMPEACSTFSATYRIGNGPAGNVGADTIVTLFWRDRVVSGLTLEPRNPLPASGGTAAESVARARLIAPQAFRRAIQRAITADDYARLAERDRTDTIQRAGGSLAWTGSWYEARVAIDPRGTATPSARLLRDVRGGLYPYRRMGHDVDVTGARLVPIEIALEICVLPHYLRGHVEAALRETFGNRLRSDGRQGYFHPDRLTFGQSIYLSRLVAEAQAVPGVQSARVVTLRRLGEIDAGEIASGVLAIGRLEVAQLDNDPNFPEHGKLTLTLEGGR